MAKGVISVKSVVVLGGEGTVGSAFKDYIRLPRRQCDITDICSIRDMVTKYRPYYIINCASIVGTQRCEDNKELAYAVNLGGVVNLISICNRFSIKLIHISTVYASEDNAYCSSKLLAEEVIKRTSNNYLIVSLPWVFNEDDDSFISNSIKSTVYLYDDEIGFLAYAKDVVSFIKKNIEMVGCINLANRRCLKRKDALCELSILLDRKIDFKTKDRRIKMPSIMNKDFFFMRSWQEALKEYADGIRSMQSTI